MGRIQYAVNKSGRMIKYDIGDIIIHHCYPLNDGYYLVEDIKTVVEFNKVHERYSLRHLLLNYVCDHSTGVIDNLDSIERIA